MSRYIRIRAATLLMVLSTSVVALDRPAHFITASEPPTLMASTVDVAIEGVIATVRLHQLYANPNLLPVDARYRFPKSHRAAISGLVLDVGSDRVVAEIREVGKAKVEYREAVEQGRGAALMTQLDSSWTEINVGNIPPGELIEITVDYTEILEPEAGVYRFEYPVPPGTAAFELVGTVVVPLDLQFLHSPTHATEVSKTVRGGRFSLPEGAETERIFALEFGMRSEQTSAGALVQEVDGERYFALMIEPPEVVEANDEIGREFVFLVDVSWSMNGAPMAEARSLMKTLLGELTPADRFNVVQFAGGSKQWAEESVAATNWNRRLALWWLALTKASGGTQLATALAPVLNREKLPGYARTVVVLTDGMIAVDRSTMELIEAVIGDTNLVAVGLGDGDWGVEFDTIRQLARMGRTQPVLISSAENADETRDKLVRSLTRPVVTDLRIETEGLEDLQLTPTALPDLIADQPLLLLGKASAEAQGLLRLRGNIGSREWVQEFQIGTTVDPGASLATLLARKRIAELEGWVAVSGDSEAIAQITQLGLRHSLLTNYTAFLATTESAVVAPDQHVSGGAGLSLGAVGDALHGALSAMHTLTDPETVSRLVFLAGDLGDPFFASAELYHRSRPEAKVIQVQTLQQIREALTVHSGPDLQSVELVVHGWEWSGVDLALDATGAPVTLSSLQRLDPLSGVESITDRSVLVIDGCGLGNAPEFVAGLAAALGFDNPDQVSAPTSLVRYDTLLTATGPVVQRSLQPFSAFVIPGQANESGVVAELIHRYGQTDSYWSRELSRMLEQGNARVAPLRVGLPMASRDLERGSSAAALARRDRTLRRDLSGVGLGLDDFTWRKQVSPGRIVGEATAVVLHGDW